MVDVQAEHQEFQELMTSDAWWDADGSFVMETTI
jgi:hypothetical protein